MLHVILNGEKYVAILNGERVRFEYFDPACLAFFKSLAAFGVAVNDVTKERHLFIKQNINEITKEAHSFISKD